MKKGFFRWMAILFFLPLLPSTVLAQDPGIPDTVRFDGGELPVWTGRASISARYFTDEWLT
jgi:hypothetical protein